MKLAARFPGSGKCTSLLGFGLGQTANWPCSVHRVQFSPNPYPSTYWMFQRLTSSCLASSRWLTPFDRSTRMYFRCRSVRLGRRPGKRPAARALAWPATERSLSEFRHHSLKASTIESRSRSVDVSKSCDRDRNSTSARCRPSITCSPQVSPVSGADKVDRVGGRSLAAIMIAGCHYMVVESCQPTPEVTPEQGGLRTSFWSTPERSM